MVSRVPVVAHELPVVVHVRLDGAALDGADVLAQQFADAAHIAAHVDLQQLGQLVALLEDVGISQQLGGGTVVVDGHHEAVIVLHRTAIHPGQVLDAVAGLLGDVEVILDACKGIVQVVADGRVECDGHITRLPGLEEGSRPLHELTQLPAVHLQLVQGVLVGVDACHVALADGTLAHLGGHGGQSRCGHPSVGVVHLYLVDEVQQSGILHHGLGQAVDLVFGGQITADQLADGGHGVVLSALVVLCQQSGQLGVGSVVLDDQVLRGAVLHLPLAVQAALEIDVDVGDGGTGILVLDHQHTVDHLVGDALVAVSGDDDVELGAGICQVGDAGAIDAVLIVNIHMHNADDDIHIVLDLINDLAALVHRVGDSPALEVLGVPAGDVGSDHTDDADLDAALFDDGVAVRQRLAFGAVDVAGQHLGLLLGEHLFQRSHAIVVLMVAGDVDIVADGVLSSDHGVDIVVQEQLSGVCLNGVACIHDQRGLGAVLLDGSCLLGHAAGGVGLVGGVIPGVKLTVGIAGGKYLQVHAPQVFDAGSGSSRDQTAHCGGGSRCTGHAQEITAGNLILFHNNSSLFCLVYTPKHL